MPGVTELSPVTLLDDAISSVIEKKLRQCDSLRLETM